MAPVNGKKYLTASLAEVRRRTRAGEKVAVSFDVDNTLVDTRGRALAIGKAFDRQNGTRYFTGKTAKAMGNDAKETATLVGMTPEHAKKFSALWFRMFFDGSNYRFDLEMKATIDLAKKAAAAGADVYFVTARTQREEVHTIAQLESFGLDTDDHFVVSKARMRDKTPEYKASELKKLSERYDYVGWFLTESRADIAGVQKLDTPVTSVLLETRFSGDRAVDPETPIWKLSRR